MLSLENFVISVPRATKKRKIEGIVNIITLGCSKNTVDSEQLATQLQANGFKVEFESDKIRPITIINTCGFIKDSKMQSIETILECIEHKKSGEIEILLVFGCLSQRYKDELKKEIPEADAFFGVDSLKDILSFLGSEIQLHLLDKRIVSTPKHYAYLKISEGCNHNCSFCAIPGIRGKHVSKPIDKILREAEFLIKNGTKELILIAQDLTSYGIDLYHKRILDELIGRLSDIPDLHWIRLHYAYPNNFPLNILDIIKNHKNICHYLDIPVQHVNDDILSGMKRNISGKEIKNLLYKIRKEIPDIALRTSLIVGFPGETKKKFNELLSFVEETCFERLGVFTYSHEENTSAYELKDSISQSEKERRKEKIMLLQQDISLKHNRDTIGKTLKVLIDSQTSSHYTGRTEYDSPEVDNNVLINRRNNKCKIGEFYNVKITKADCFDLYGNVIQT